MVAINKNLARYVGKGYLESNEDSNFLNFKYVLRGKRLFLEQPSLGKSRLVAIFNERRDLERFKGLLEENMRNNEANVLHINLQDLENEIRPGNWNPSNKISLHITIDNLRELIGAINRIVSLEK